MEAVFLKLVNMSITASYLVAAVLVLRLILKRSPKWIRVALWGLVGLRLVLPFSFESILSLIPSTEPLPQEFLYAATPRVQTGIPYVNNMLNPVIAQSLAPAELTSANPTQIWSFIFSQLWILGVVIMGLYALISYLIVRRRVRPSIRVTGNLYLCDSIETPFILGIGKPRIYLPSSLDQTTADHVLAHELAHLKRRDHWWKPLGFLLLTVYWFNPVMWLAYILLCRDIEMACDERVIREMDAMEKKAYSRALLQCSVPRHMIAACPLAFGEVGVKTRIKSVLNYKKPAFWVMVIALILCAVFAVCFLTDPVGVPFADIIPGRSGEVLSITVIHGQEQYEITTESRIKYVEDLLREIMVGKTEVSKSRSVDRDKYNTLILHHENHDTFYHFNQSCTEVWYDNTVKPTMTYHVKNEEKLLQFFESRIEAPAESVDWEDACRKVLADIQSRDNYHISVTRQFEGENFLNDSSNSQYFKSEENLLAITYIPADGSHDLIKMENGQYYEDVVYESTVKWEPMENPDDTYLIPWLYSFQWNESNVDAIALQDSGDHYFIRLKINEPIYDTDSYHVDFYFDRSGEFLWAVQTIQEYVTDPAGNASPHTTTATMVLQSTAPEEISERIGNMQDGAFITSVNLPSGRYDGSVCLYWPVFSSQLPQLIARYYDITEDSFIPIGVDEDKRVTGIQWNWQNAADCSLSLKFYTDWYDAMKDILHEDIPAISNKLYYQKLSESQHLLTDLEGTVYYILGQAQNHAMENVSAIYLLKPIDAITPGNSTSIFYNGETWASFSARDTLDMAIYKAIMEHQTYEDKRDLTVWFESHTILSHMVGCGKAETAPDAPCGFTEVDVIAMVIGCQEKDGELIITESKLIPAVISFDEYSDGSMKLTEYLQDNGDVSIEEFMEKHFSPVSAEDQKPLQHYESELMKMCTQQANAYFGLTE